jgi:menaquinone-dependent protoporphyrinogen oxidase
MVPAAEAAALEVVKAKAIFELAVVVLVERQARGLAGRPVWLFSSGPVGDPPKPDEDPVDVAELLAATNARDHRVFAGKLVRKQLSFPERAIVAALHVPEGDFRDWTEIRQWAAGIADAMGAGS